MIEETLRVPADHPIRVLFRQLTERGMSQLNLRDSETIQYITNLLMEFVRADNVGQINWDSGHSEQYLFRMMEQAETAVSPVLQRQCYRYLGDSILFQLGLFPESLTYGHRTVSLNYYAQTGRRSYIMVAEMDSSPGQTNLYRNLSRQFEQCVVGLNWVKRYISDPFYQFMFREFPIS